jgi:hypothetical protein
MFVADTDILLKFMALWISQSTDIESVCPCDKTFQIQVNDSSKVCVLSYDFLL